jgi:hypothetical protein
MRYIFIVILSIISAALYSQKKDTLTLSGFNYGRNLIVLNPFNADGKGFSVTEVLVNNNKIKTNSGSTIFDIDLTKNNIKLNEAVKVKIVHSFDAPAKVYNPECITREKLETIDPLDSLGESKNYALKDKSICILTGKLNFENKNYDIGNYWFGFQKLTRNSQGVFSGIGSPDEEGRYIGIMTYNDLYSIDLDYFEKDQPTKIVYRFLVDLRGIPEDKKRGQLINLDILVKENMNEKLYKFNEDFPTRKLFYNSYNQALMWDKDYENVILKTTEALTKQIDQENSLKVLEFEKTAEQQQKKYLYMIITAIGIITVIAILAFFRQRKLKKLINLQKTEVEKQKHFIEEKQKEIIDSIRYAKRIQSSLMPTEKYITKNLRK